MSLAIASPATPCLATDERLDRAGASDGESRFGSCLALRLPPILQHDPDVLTDPARWASCAWAAASPPVMTPGFVQWNDPVEDIRVGCEEGALVIEIVVRTACPVGLTGGWRSWQRDCRGQVVEPGHGDRIALSRTTLRAVLREVPLPLPPPGLGDRTEVVRLAKLAVHLVATEVHQLLESVLSQLDRGSQGA